MSSAPPPAPHPGYSGQSVAAPAAGTAASAAPVAPLPEQPREEQRLELRIYSHSTFLYWWPVWLTGYVMALVTRLDGKLLQMGDTDIWVWMHPSKNLGVLFTLLFFLVILITNVSLRGLASVVALLAVAFGALLLAYFGWWDDVLNWMGQVAIYMNLGFYVFFSTLVLLVWAFSVFGYDRFSYWRVTPGQLTHDQVIGGAQKSYDTRGMVFEKHRQDLFRHWILGFGSGDIEISTTGARRETFSIPNVLFVNGKISEIQKMIATSPDDAATPST